MIIIQLDVFATLTITCCHIDFKYYLIVKLFNLISQEDYFPGKHIFSAWVVILYLILFNIMILQYH